MLDRLNITNAVSKFSDAQEVLDYLRDVGKDASKLPDIILLDLNMPVMDGWEFLDRFQQIRPMMSKGIRVYVLTSSIDEKDQERVSSYDFVSGYLTKPLTNDVIMQLAD
ncbi:response regulator [Chitinophaga horti]|uniref:Response regulator n=1 Tax=Chitinophaga horti TaxID=2920382 RepID=A0ABY6J4X3_9BACT|nr:response regulator [Chitinophaga horti]UYQ94728.1 response regulator [Chitinophaga horti]